MSERAIKELGTMQQIVKVEYHCPHRWYGALLGAAFLVMGGLGCCPAASHPAMASAVAREPMKALERARLEVRNGDYASAIHDYLWCLDHGAAADSSFRAVRDAYVSLELASLASRYPDVLRILSMRQTALEKRLLQPNESDDPSDDASMLHSINVALGQPYRSLFTYRSARAPEIRRALFEQVLGTLLNEKSYRELYANVDVLQARFDGWMRSISVFRRVGRRSGVTVLRHLFAQRRRDAATAWLRRILVLDPTDDAYVELVNIAVESGYPSIACVTRRVGLEDAAGASRTRLRALSDPCGMSDRLDARSEVSVSDVFLTARDEFVLRENAVAAAFSVEGSEPASTYLSVLWAVHEDERARAALVRIQAVALTGDISAWVRDAALHADRPEVAQEL